MAKVEILPKYFQKLYEIKVDGGWYGSFVVTTLPLGLVAAVEWLRKQVTLEHGGRGRGVSAICFDPSHFERQLLKINISKYTSKPLCDGAKYFGNPNPVGDANAHVCWAGFVATAHMKFRHRSGGQVIGWQLFQIDGTLCHRPKIITEESEISLQDPFFSFEFSQVIILKQWIQWLCMRFLKYTFYAFYH